MYSPGIPILYLVGVLTFFITYWVDKILCNLFTNLLTIVLHFYRKPPVFSEVLCKTTTYTFYYAVPVHLLGGLLMFSELDILGDSHLLED
jgi:hypothetical protein